LAVGVEPGAFLGLNPTRTRHCEQQAMPAMVCRSTVSSDFPGTRLQARADFARKLHKQGGLSPLKPSGSMPEGLRPPVESIQRPYQYPLQQGGFLSNIELIVAYKVTA
jgi:hypothetical protein